LVEPSLVKVRIHLHKCGYHFVGWMAYIFLFHMQPVGTSKTGYPIFTAKTTYQGNIMAHGPSQLAQALLCSKPKPKDKCSSPPTLLRFVRPP
jgi:hypothetical protein